MPPSIFQQIVLPYLASRSSGILPCAVRSFTTTPKRSRPPANTDSSSISSPSSSNHGSSSTWEYIPPARPVSYHTGHDPPPPRPIYPDAAVLRPLPRGKSSWKRRNEREDTARDKEVQAFLRKLESLNVGQKETVIMAMERIISASSSKAKVGLNEKTQVEQVERRSEPDGGRPNDKTVIIGRTDSSAPNTDPRTEPLNATALQVRSDEPSPSTLLIQPHTQSKIIPQPLEPTPQPSSQPTFIPPSIHSLLQSRLYRLTVYHLLQTPEYAVDQNLLDRVAGWMKRDGAGKLARRLERGCDGRQADRTDVDQDTISSIAGEGVSTKNDAGLPIRSPTGNPYRLPPDTWQPPRRSAPSLPCSLPSAPLDRSKALTSAYNAHLSRSLFSPKKSSSSLSPHQSHSTTRPLSRPSANLAQLRQLLIRIEKLEKHRGFKPDWITANLVVKCWMWCTYSDSGRGKKIRTNGGSDSRGVRRGNDRDVEEGLGAVELRGIFEFVRRTYEGAVEEQYGRELSGVKKSFGLRQSDLTQTASSQPISSSPTQSDPKSQFPVMSSDDVPIKPASPDSYKQRISYTRHIRPFAHDLARAFRRIGDQGGFERVVGWQKRMRERIEGG